ncbi:MAG: hypothetical protein K2I51_00020, partial [Muribaculaceae bacterium]|nr:hypothetical protein [Muribaculaceae bacterium]
IDVIVLTIPQSIKYENPDAKLAGISGRYIKVQPYTVDDNKIYWAPEIPYTIGNDDEGYIHVTLNIPEENLPTEMSAFMVINNNKENREQPFFKDANGKWTVKSKYPYPNNRTISYYFRVNISGGGQAVTRSFGYLVENVSNETSEPETLTSLAEKALGEGKVSGQIYTLHAHDTSYQVKDEEKGEGKWFRAARPVDYANVSDQNHEDFYFCPPFEYIIANDASATDESSIFVAVKFPEFDGKTIIPTDFKAIAVIYDKDLASATTRAYTGYPEAAELTRLEMEQVPGMVNTYQTNSADAKKFAIDKNLGVAFRYEYWSILEGNGFSTTGPRTYVMSADNTVVTGIEETGADAEPALSTVYNLQGIAVRINVATEEALAGLPAGIYIVNGKKYAVK